MVDVLCLLLVVGCLNCVGVVSGLLFVVGCFGVRCVLCVASFGLCLMRCLRFVVYVCACWFLFVVFSLLFVLRCLLFVGGCWLFVVCCLLCVVCC